MRILCGNIYAGVYREKVWELLTRPEWDALCIQEMPEVILNQLRETGQYQAIAYAPQVVIGKNKHGRDYPEGYSGIAILSKQASQTTFVNYGDTAWASEWIPGPRPQAHWLATTIVGGLTINSTHYTWAPDLTVTQRQLDAWRRMRRHLGTGVLCGDFNMQEGNDLFMELITEGWVNKTPPGTTSLDPNLHRVKNLQVKCDWCLHTPGYEVESRYIFGCSDHALQDITICKTDGDH